MKKSSMAIDCRGILDPVLRLKPDPDPTEIPGSCTRPREYKNDIVHYIFVHGKIEKLTECKTMLIYLYNKHKRIINFILFSRDVYR